MNVAIDSNILLRSIHHQNPHQPIVKAALETLAKRNETLCLFPQMLSEFWTVATRPMKMNGLGLSAIEAYSELIRIKSLFQLFPDSPAVLPEWEKIVVQKLVLGKNGHDARIVAAMNVHGSTHLLTCNRDDFKRFSSITALLPDEVYSPVKTENQDARAKKIER